jgi:hypothetical protein
MLCSCVDKEPGNRRQYEDTSKYATFQVWLQDQQEGVEPRTDRFKPLHWTLCLPFKLECPAFVRAPRISSDTRNSTNLIYVLTTLIES